MALLWQLFLIIRSPIVRAVIFPPNINMGYYSKKYFVFQIPKALVPHYCELVSANPKSRPNPSVLLSSLREHGGFLASNYVSIALRIEELQVYKMFLMERPKL